MRRILLLVLAGLWAGFLMGGKSEATHILGPGPTPLCENSPCVLEVANHFGTYGTLNGDPRYQQALEGVVNDWSKSGVYLKLIPSAAPRPDLATGAWCFDNENPLDNFHPCLTGECYSTNPEVHPYNCFQNLCQGGDIAVCADLLSTDGGADSGVFSAKINCYISPPNSSGGDGCNPFGYDPDGGPHSVRHMLCHEIGHTLGLNHEGNGCMFSSNDRPNIHDVNAVAALHVGLGPGCGGQQYCYSSLAITSPDEDGDGLLNVDEANCGDGSYWNDATKTFEKSDGVDNNGNSLIDETLLQTYSPLFTDLVTESRIDDYDCDGDGFKGEAEQFIFSWSTSDTSKDQDRCGGTTWPLDLLPDNHITLQDAASFVAPVDRMNTITGDPNYSPRWDLIPNGTINLQDMAALTAGPTAYPPMFLGVKAWNGPTCTD